MFFHIAFEFSCLKKEKAKQLFKLRWLTSIGRSPAGFPLIFQVCRFRWSFQSLLLATVRLCRGPRDEGRHEKRTHTPYKYECNFEMYVTNRKNRHQRREWHGIKWSCVTHSCIRLHSDLWSDLAYVGLFQPNLSSINILTESHLECITILIGWIGFEFVLLFEYHGSPSYILPKVICPYQQ